MKTFVCRCGCHAADHQRLKIKRRISLLALLHGLDTVASICFDTCSMKMQGGEFITEFIYRTGIGWVVYYTLHRLQLKAVDSSLIVLSKQLPRQLLLAAAQDSLSVMTKTSTHMEELAMACNALSLHPAEASVKPPALPSLNHDSSSKVTIVGKLFHPKNITPSALFRAMANVWHLQRKLLILSSEAGRAPFDFTFASPVGYSLEKTRLIKPAPFQISSSSGRTTEADPSSFANGHIQAGTAEKQPRLHI